MKQQIRAISVMQIIMKKSFQVVNMDFRYAGLLVFAVTFVVAQISQVLLQANIAYALPTFSNSPVSGYPTVSTGGEILASVLATDGSTYVGGEFSSIGGVSRNDLAKILPNGTVDPSFVPAAEFNVGNSSGTYVMSLALDEATGSLYVGGGMTNGSGAQTRTNIATLNSTTGEVKNYNMSTDGPVRALALNSDKTKLYAGGDFDYVNSHTGVYGGQGRFAIDDDNNKYIIHNQSIKKYDANDNFVTSWSNPSSGPASVGVDHDGNVYVSYFADGTYIVKYTSDGTYLSQWGSAGSGDGQFMFIQSISADSLNNIYVADQGNSRIQKFDSSGNFITKWGSAGSGDGEFSALQTIDLDSSDNVYVFDAGNWRIQKFDSTGVFIAQWGTYGYGDGEFDAPYGGLSIDNSNTIFVADFNNNRVQSYSSAGVYTGQWNSEALGYPRNIGVDNAGRVYILNDSGLVSKYQNDGTFMSRLGERIIRAKVAAFSTATGSVDAFDAEINTVDSPIVRDIEYYGVDNSLYIAGYFTEVGGSARTGLAKVDAATGAINAGFNPDLDKTSPVGVGEVYRITINNGTLYAGGDFDTVNNSVTRNHLASFNAGTAALGSFNPNVNGIVHAMSVDAANGTIYVGGAFDTVNGSVARNEIAGINLTSASATNFNPNITNQESNVIANPGVGGGGGGGYTVYDLLINPTTGLISAGGTFTHVGGSVIRGLAAFQTAYCNYAPFTLTDPDSIPPNFSLKFAGPNMVVNMASDSSGNVYVLDVENSNVIKYSPTGSLLGQWNQPGDYLMGIAIDSSGKIYVSAEGMDDDIIKVFSSSMVYQNEWVQYATDMVFDSQDNLYTLSGGTINKFSTTGTLLDSWPLDTGGSLGMRGIDVDSQDNIYVIDTSDRYIVKYSPAGDNLDQWGAIGSGNGQFDFPMDLAIDGNDKIYVADANNSGRIQKFDLTGNYESQWGSWGSGNGQFTFDIGDGESYVGLMVDGSDNLYVADFYASNIQKFTQPNTFIDFDGDGLSDTEEMNSPNNGDANNDCVYDVVQPNVGSIQTDLPSTYATITGPTGTNFTTVTTLDPVSTNDEYPFGLLDFELDGVATGAATQIDVYFYSSQPAAQFVARKYFPATQTYQNIPGAIISSETINGQPAIHLTYSIVDGSSFDLDGSANGTIVDPVGLMVLGASTTSGSLSNTGTSVLTASVVAGGVVAVGIVLSPRKRKDTSK